MVQALTFRNDPKLLAHLATYEAKLTKNFQINLNMLLKLQSLPARPGKGKSHDRNRRIVRLVKGCRVGARACPPHFVL